MEYMNLVRCSYMPSFEELILLLTLIHQQYMVLVIKEYHREQNGLLYFDLRSEQRLIKQCQKATTQKDERRNVRMNRLCYVMFICDLIFPQNNFDHTFIFQVFIVSPCCTYRKSMKFGIQKELLRYQISLAVGTK